MENIRNLIWPLAALLSTLAPFNGCAGRNSSGPGETVAVTFDVTTPAGTPAASRLFLTGDVLPSGVDVDFELSRLNAGAFGGRLDVAPNATLQYVLRLVDPAAAELDSAWEPVSRNLETGEDATAASLAVARWDYPPDPARPAILFLVHVPPTTPPGDPVWISGNLPELGVWNGAGVKLHRRSDGDFAARVEFPLQSGLEFKVTRGSWETVEKGAAGEEIPNRTHVATAADTVHALVARWRDQSGGAQPILTGDIRYHRGVVSQFLSLPRDVIVYLPPDYGTNTTRRYPVLYMHDGQNLMDATTSFLGVEWGMDETAERLIEAGEIEPVIIAGIYNTPDRIAEYTYTPRPDEQHGGGNAANYARFLVEELKPMIDATYRTKPEAEETGVAGSSLGGNVSLYLGLTRSSVYTRIGVVSPAAWFAGNDLIRWVRETPKQPVVIREDIGTEEGAAALAGARALRDELVQKGWTPGVDLDYFEAVGAGHNEAAWAARADRILMYLYPAAP
jgi:predicted alpha/beta superfamily hydrolase